MNNNRCAICGVGIAMGAVVALSAFPEICGDCDKRMVHLPSETCRFEVSVTTDVASQVATASGVFYVAGVGLNQGSET